MYFLMHFRGQSLCTFEFLHCAGIIQGFFQPFWEGALGPFALENLTEIGKISLFIVILFS